MTRRPPRATRTDPLLPYTTLFRSPGFECAASLDAGTGLDMNQQRRHRAAQRFVATARGGGNDFAVEQQAHFEAVAIAETMHEHVRGQCALQRAGIGKLSVVTAAGATAHGASALVFRYACRLLPGAEADPTFAAKLRPITR